jgi:phosphatidylserine decarboxylase
MLGLHQSGMKLPAHLQAVAAPIHRAGWPFIAGALVLAVLLGLVAQALFWLGLILAGWVAYFFRDPDRVVPIGDALVVSPADGTVLTVQPRRPPPELGFGEAPRLCVSIFLSIFDVHVNRAPVGGRIARLAYHQGKFFNAADDKASEENERQCLRIERPNGGGDVGVALIAGLVARRIVGFVEEGATVAAGERIALIRFGSRADVYLPDGMVPMVVAGQKAIGGETVLADGRSNQPWREGRTT